LAAFLILGLCGTVAQANDIIICKKNDATNPVPTGSVFNFTIDPVAPGSNPSSPNFQLTVDGDCVSYVDVGQGPHTITEAVPAGEADSNITVDPPERLVSFDLTLGTVVANAEDVATPTTVTFYNKMVPQPPPPGNQGCTPGYWKQSQHFDSWVGLSPTDLVSSVFSGALPALAGETLLDALQGGGGNGLIGGEKILLRAAVAALLNANSIDYPFMYADIVTAVDMALANGNRDADIALGGILDAANNGQGGCPLN
jgi:hypothetical protein